MNRQLMNEQMQVSQLGGNQDIFWKLHFFHSLIYIFYLIFITFLLLLLLFDFLK